VFFWFCEGWWLSVPSTRLEHMFDTPESQRPETGAGVEYGQLWPVAPGAVDPVRAAALAEAIEDGALVWDPAEEALFGPEPDVDVRALFAALDAGSALGGAGAGEGADGEDGWPSVAVDAVGTEAAEMADPRGLVPAHMPRVEDMAPGPELAGLLHQAALSELGAFELVEVIAGWHRLASWAAARQAAAIMELSRRAEMAPTGLGRRVESMSALRVAATEVAARLAVTPTQGEGLAARARVWCTELPATHAALREGRIDVGKAEVIADALRGRTLELAHAVEAEVLPHAEVMTAPRLRRAIIRAQHRLDPDTMASKAEHATDNRYVRFTPARDGMAWLEAYLPAADAAALQTAVEAAAAAMKRSDPDDGRTLAQRRADALAQLGWLALAAGRLGGCGCGQPLDNQHRRPVSVQVTVPIGLLLGLDDTTPAELTGYGPIPAETARRLAAHGTWRRLLTNPASGTVLDYGRTRYEPPPDLVDHVHARDQRCRFPWCEQPASGCDTDHTIPYPHGLTAAGNLGPLCQSHHLSKHHSRWTVRQPQPGRFEWTSPTGHTYTITPEPLTSTHDEYEQTAGDPDPPDTADPDPPDTANPLPPADDIPPF
jgi:Domain of unknown function (DUF222)